MVRNSTTAGDARRVCSRIPDHQKGADDENVFTTSYVIFQTRHRCLRLMPIRTPQSSLAATTTLFPFNLVSVGLEQSIGEPRRVA